MSSKDFREHEISEQPERQTIDSLKHLSDLKNEVARIRKDIDRMKENHTTVKSNLNAEKRHQAESQAYNALFDPVFSRTSAPEKDGKTNEVSPIANQTRHEEEKSATLPTDSQQAQQNDYKSREIARQQKQKQWQEEFKN